MSEWVSGRQDATYQKKKLVQFCLFKTFFDAYLIRYKPFVELPTHVDNVENHRHFRLNVVLKGHGHFACEKSLFQFGERVILFESGKYEHSMVNGHEERLVLSIGCAY